MSPFKWLITMQISKEQDDKPTAKNIHKTCIKWIFYAILTQFDIKMKCLSKDFSRIRTDIRKKKKTILTNANNFCWVLTYILSSAKSSRLKDRWLYWRFYTHTHQYCLEQDTRKHWEPFATCFKVQAERHTQSSRLLESQLNKCCIFTARFGVSVSYSSMGFYRKP